MKAKKLMKIVRDMYGVLRDRGDTSEATIVEEHDALVSLTEKFGKSEEKWFFNIVGNDVVFWENGDINNKAAISCKNIKKLRDIMVGIRKV